MIQAPTNKSKKNDTTSKSDGTVSDSIIPPILEPSLASEFSDLKDLVTTFSTKLEKCINRLTDLEGKLFAPLDLQKPLDLSLSAKVEELSNSLTYCEQNHEGVVQKFYNYKKDVHDFLGMGTPSYMNSSYLPSPSHDHDVPMSFRMVLEKIGNPLDPLTNHHFQTFLTQYNKWQHYRDRGGYLSL
jgi:hypothetical protein